MEQVFISYSFRDRDIADKVCVSLEREGISCWIAPRNVSAGERYTAAITQAVQKAPAVLLLLSRTANGSEHVARELCIAFEQKIRIIPARIEDIQPQGELLYILAAAHWIDLLPNDFRLPDVAREVRKHTAERISVDSGAEARELQELNEKAHHGDLDSQYLLGRRSSEPRNSIFDLQTAAYWYRRAAEQGHAESAYQLAHAYDKGAGVVRSQADALRWMMQAAKYGDARAQTRMGLHLLAESSRQEKSIAEAAGWFGRAAEQGSLEALYQLSVLYAEGRGVRRSDALALDGFRTLAAAGHAGAQYYLAWMLSHGRATTPNREEARQWAERAASQGHGKALHLLRELGS